MDGSADPDARSAFVLVVILLHASGVARLSSKPDAFDPVAMVQNATDYCTLLISTMPTSMSSLFTE